MTKRGLLLLWIVALVSCSRQAPEAPSGVQPPTQQQQQQINRAIAEATVDGKRVSINYGKPSLSGRDLLAMAPVGTVWRVGMNEATEITSETDLMVGQKRVPAGTYSLWVRKIGDNDWTLAFHPSTGIWGAPEMREGYIAEAPLSLEQATESVEHLAIDLSTREKEVLVSIHWGPSKLTGTLEAM